MENTIGYLETLIHETKKPESEVMTTFLQASKDVRDVIRL